MPDNLIFVFELLKIRDLSHRDILSLSRTCKQLYNIFYKKYLKFPIIATDKTSLYFDTVDKLLISNARKCQLMLTRHRVCYNTFDRTHSLGRYLTNFTKYVIKRNIMILFGEIASSTDHFYIEDFGDDICHQYYEIKTFDSGWIGFSNDNQRMRRVQYAHSLFALEIRGRYYVDTVGFNNSIEFRRCEYIILRTSEYVITMGLYDT